MPCLPSLHNGTRKTWFQAIFLDPKPNSSGSCSRCPNASWSAQHDQTSLKFNVRFIDCKAWAWQGPSSLQFLLLELTTIGWFLTSIKYETHEFSNHYQSNSTLHVFYHLMPFVQPEIPLVVASHCFWFFFETPADPLERNDSSHCLRCVFGKVQISIDSYPNLSISKVTTFCLLDPKITHIFF